MVELPPLTVWFPRFLTLQARWVVLPATPVTFPLPSGSNQGPESDPVGLGVADAYIWLRSAGSERHRCAGWAAKKDGEKENDQARVVFF